jgi:RecB family exonuclease
VDFTLNQISVSKLGNFINCPYHFYLHYIVKRKPESENEYANVGKALHEALEDINKELQQGVARQPGAYTSLIIEKVKKYEISESYVMKFQMYVGSYLKQILPLFGECTLVGIESKIDVQMELNGKMYKFIGYIDIVLLNSENEILLFDYKHKLREQKDVDILLTRDMQVQTYSMAISQHGGIQRGFPPHLHFRGKGVPVKTYGHIQFIDKDQTVAFIHNTQFNYEEMKKRLEYWVAQIEAAVEKEYFPRNPGGLCPYCDQKNFCLGKRL